MTKQEGEIMSDRKVYLVCTSGGLCGPSIRGPFTMPEVRELLVRDDDSFVPVSVADVVLAPEAARMVLGGRYQDFTTLSPQKALAIDAKMGRKARTKHVMSLFAATGPVRTATGACGA